MTATAQIHFVGFRGDEYWSAVKVWGLPDHYHIGWDKRAVSEVAAHDVVVFAVRDDRQPLSVHNCPNTREEGSDPNWRPQNK